MKKIEKLSLLLISGLVLCFAGCKQPAADGATPSSNPKPRANVSEAKIGDVVMEDGKIWPFADWRYLEQEVVAVIVREKNGTTPALGIGVQLSNVSAQWCDQHAQGMGKIEDLIGNSYSGYMDGSTGWSILAAFVEDEDEQGNYPVWNECLKYGTYNHLTGDLENGWYLPTINELHQIYTKKEVINASLEATSGKKLQNNNYWSCCQYYEGIGNYSDMAAVLNLSNGMTYSYEKKYSGPLICAVRAFN